MEGGGTNEEVIIFERKMIPIQLAWALTTHKIQGLTLTEGVVDLGENNFDPTQIYINISRFKNLESFYISHKLINLKKNYNIAKIKLFLKKISENRSI